MSHHIYTTKGLVLTERPLREADRIYNILTQDLGLIKATTIGVRKEHSKLRGHLEPFSLSVVSLVRGKEYWRTTSAEVIKNISPTLFVARPLALLDRLIQGETPHPELFDAVESTLLSSLPHDEMLEIRLVSQILLHLGYLKKSDLDLGKRELLVAVNEGIQASHL